jgi:hypothetical protein
MRKLRNGLVVVLVVLSVAALNAVNYVSGFPHCDDPDPTNVHVAAWGSMDCEDENERWAVCQDACGFCEPGFTHFGVEDCQDYPSLNYFELQCTCWGMIEG